MLTCGLILLTLPIMAAVSNSDRNESLDFIADYSTDCDELCQYRMIYDVDELDENKTLSEPIYLHRILYYICLPVTCSIGIASIVTTIIVLNRKSMSTSTNSYFFALAFADLIFLTLLMARTLDHKFGFGYNFLICMAYGEIVWKICLLVSVWLTVVLGVERHIAISRPLHAQRLCTVRNARLIIFAIYSLALLCRFPDFFQFFVIWTYDPRTKRSYPHVEHTVNSVWYTSIQPWLIDGLLTAVLPIILLTGLNVKLIYEVRKSVSRMRPMQNAYTAPTLISREEIRITAMLISIIVIFFLLQAPYIICLAFLDPRSFHSLETKEILIIVQDVTFLLVSVKTAMNFVLYCWFSERFWTLLKSMVCCGELCQHKLPKHTRRNTANESSATAPANTVKYSHVVSRETTI